jgi:hypothetical protein
MIAASSPYWTYSRGRTRLRCRRYPSRPLRFELRLPTAKRGDLAEFGPAAFDRRGVIRHGVHLLLSGSHSWIRWQERCDHLLGRQLSESLR